MKIAEVNKRQHSGSEKEAEGNRSEERSRCDEKLLISPHLIKCYKLCKVKKVSVGPKGVPFLVTSDGRTLRYPDPLVKVNDSILYDLEKSKMKDIIKFDSGNLCMITGGRNLGRVGTIVSRERHAGSFDIVHVKDAVGHTFATR
ncbi:40S ribosomal protein S4 [Portunus trituberculatus]|uniref:40S ribosomal protein S4 n=1 Tax=Portunus trituberculatus TaxID=210409 RepID=A0A5B7GUS1_PORTR|nr:40S ribosomal protein S4 [Portunus trituberculatus]